jgi:hypothetical protein
VCLSTACSPLSNESTSQKGLAIEAAYNGVYYDYAFVPARSFEEWGEQLPGATLLEREAEWRRELEELGIVNQASAAVFATALDAEGNPSFVPQRPDLPLRYTCGATFISPSFALTAAHCVASDVSAPSVHLYRPRDGLVQYVAAATVLSGTWPNLSHPQLTADNGYQFDSYDCEIAVRCDDNWGPTLDCPYNIQGRDVAVLHCPEAPGTSYGFVDVASEQPALGTELFMAWKHEVYDLTASSVAPQDLTQHYVQRISPETNLHYFGGDQNQLLPLRSRPWSSGEPRTMGSDGWTDLMGCHGTSGSGLLARDENGSGFQLWGIATSGLSLTARLCHDPLADSVGDALIGSNWYEPGVLVDQLRPTLDEDCRTAFSTELVRSVDGLGFDADRYRVASWFSQQRCQPLSSTQAATGERFLLEAVAERGVTLTTAENVAVGPFQLQAGRDYRLGAHVVQPLPCATPCSSFTLEPSAGGDAFTFILGAEGERQSVAASFRAATSGEVELLLSNALGAASFVGLTLLEEGQTNTFDVVFDRLETSLYALHEGDLIGPAPMRFVGDGSVGFSALLEPAERMLLTRQALSPNRLWTARVETATYAGLSCGFSDADGAVLLAVPCAAVFQLDARALNTTPSAFFIELGAASAGITIDAVALASDAAADSDGDAIPDVLDSCVDVANPTQGPCSDAGSGANGGAGGESSSGGAGAVDAGAGGARPDAGGANGASGGAAGSAENTESEGTAPLTPADAGSEASANGGSGGSGGNLGTVASEGDSSSAAGAPMTSTAPTIPDSAPNAPPGGADAGLMEERDASEERRPNDSSCACRTQGSRNHGLAGTVFPLAALAYWRRRAREASIRKGRARTRLSSARKRHQGRGS